MTILLSACFGLLGFLLSMAIVRGLDTVDKTIIAKGVNRKAGLTVNILAGLLSLLTFLAGHGVAAGITGCLFWASLSAAAYSDGLTKEIFDWVYYPGLFACATALFIAKPGSDVFIDLAIFLALQILVFRRMYGGSDCIAFSMCAMFLSSLGAGLLICMLMMLLTMVLFTVWQWLAKNIHTKRDSGSFLKLKVPDAMIPYIFLSMAIVMIYTAVPAVYGAAVFILLFMAVYLLM